VRKKHTHIIYNLLLIIYLTSCSNQKESFFPKNINEVTYKLEGTKKVIDTLKSPYRLYILKNQLFVTQDNKVNFDEPIIHILDLLTLSPLSAIGKNGLGPNELMSASNIDLDKPNGNAIVYDGRNKRFSNFSISINSSSKLLADNQSTLPANMFDAYKIYQASDKTYLGISTQKEYIFNEYDLNGNWIQGFGRWPEATNSKELQDFSGMERNYLLSSINSGWYKKQIGGDWYALAMNYRDRIELFNFKTKALKSIKGPELIDEIQPFKIAGSGSGLGGAYSWDAKYRYRDLAIKNQNIYALYGGHSQIDYRQTGIVAETIFVFSYDMKLKGKITLDRSVVAIEVDEDLGKIYTITTDENPGIAVFDLPKELLKE